MAKLQKHPDSIRCLTFISGMCGHVHVFAHHISCNLPRFKLRVRNYFYFSNYIRFERLQICTMYAVMSSKANTELFRVNVFTTDTSFASGSIDGTIVVWSYQQESWHQLWEYVDSKAEEKTFNTSIQAMLPLAEVCIAKYITRKCISID